MGIGQGLEHPFHRCGYDGREGIGGRFHGPRRYGLAPRLPAEPCPSKFSVRLGAVAQLGERLDRTQEVRGSSPLSSPPFTIHTVTPRAGLKSGPARVLDTSPIR